MNHRPLAAPANIRRNTTPDRQFEVRVISDLRELTRGFRGQEVELELALLRARLLEAAGSPYYRELLSVHGFGVRDFESFDDLKQFPITDRSMLGDVMAQMPARFSPADDFVAVKSSGTTGKPVRVLRDRYETLYMWTVLRFFCGLVKAQPPRWARTVLLDTLPSGMEYSVRTPLFFDGGLHRISTQRPDAVERLQKVKPFALFGDPAGLHWLQSKKPRIAPAIVLTSAQYFGEAQRAAFAEVFPVPVINYYSTTETGPIAFECARDTGSFHALSPHVHVEVAGGEVLVTRLRPGAFPLFRYATGDRAVLRRGRCACGFEGSTLLNLEGRRQCAFIRADGARVDAWQLAWLFKHHTLSEFCLTQIGYDAFELLGETSPELLSTLTGALTRLGFVSPRVTATGAHVPVSAKPEPFRSLVADAPAAASAPAYQVTKKL